MHKNRRRCRRCLRRHRRRRRRCRCRCYSEGVFWKWIQSV